MARKKNSLFYKLLVSYIVIFATPLLILGGIFYYLDVVSYQREVSDANQTKLAQIKNQIDLELKSLGDIAYHLSTQSEMYGAITDELNHDETMIAPQLQAYKDHYPFIDEILFYYRGDSKIYLTSGSYKYDAFEHGVGKKYDWMGASFFRELNTISAPKAKRIVPANSASSDKSAVNEVALMYPVPFLKTIPQGTVVFMIKESDLLDKFRNIFGDFEGSIFIYDPYYNPLVSISLGNDNVDIEKLENRLRNLKGTGVSSMTVDTSHWIVTRMVSEEMDWSYLIAMPEAFFFKRVNTVRMLIVGILFILIILGFVVAILFSLKNYKPIKSLLSFLKGPDYNEIDTEGKNELEIIRFSFENALKQHKEMLVQMNAQRPFIKDQCLSTLLKGRTIDSDDLSYLIKCSNLMLEGQAYYCMVLSTLSQEPDGQLWDRIANLMENIYFVGGRGYGVELIQENHFAVILILQEYPEDIRSKQQDIADNLLRLAEENQDSRLVAGIGKMYHRPEQLSASYLEASAVIYDNQANGKKKVYFFDEIENREEQVHWYPIKEQALYLQCLKQGDTTVALVSLQALFEQITSGTTSFLMVRCLCFDVVNHVLKMINQMNFQSFSGDMKELLKFNSLQEFQAEMEQFTEAFCNQVNIYKEKKNAELKNNIINYINENFKDSSLSLEKIAGEFGLSVTFVSRFIKDETGVNFVDYLTSLRMNEAKLQLQNTDKLIQEIVTEIGYLNTPSFVRKFKALEGMTPGQYRQIVGKA